MPKDFTPRMDFNQGNKVITMRDLNHDADVVARISQIIAGVIGGDPGGTLAGLTALGDLLDAETAARVALGTTVSGNSSAITTLQGVNTTQDATIAGKCAKASNLSDVANAATAVSNLGAVPASRTVAGKALTANITLALADLTAPAADFSMNTRKIINLNTGVGDGDAVNVGQMNSAIASKATADIATLSTVVPGIAVGVNYDVTNGWVLPPGFSTLAAVFWIFTGGDAAHPPPSVTGWGVWVY